MILEGMEPTPELLIAYQDPTQLEYWYVRHQDFIRRYTTQVVETCADLAHWSQVIPEWSTDQVMVDWISEQVGA